jgi:hypothetical protein
MNQPTSTQKGLCMYGTQGQVNCDKTPSFQQCDLVHVPVCTSANATCSDPKQCKSINDKMSIRFQDEKNTWR